MGRTVRKNVRAKALARAETLPDNERKALPFAYQKLNELWNVVASDSPILHREGASALLLIGKALKIAYPDQADVDAAAPQKPAEGAKAG